MRWWAVGVVAFIATDVTCDQRGWPTFSAFTRRVLAVDTPAGRDRFTAALAIGGLVFHRHITKE